MMAVSAKVSIGSHLLVNLDHSGLIESMLSPLRATGRLFWTPYYALLAGILAAPFLWVRLRRAELLVGAALILQFADLAALRHWLHVTVNQAHVSPLRSPVWSTLGRYHQNLIVLPAVQCDGDHTPGGSDGYRTFGFLAADQRMRINSFESARYNEASRDSQCTDEIAALSDRPLSPDSAYVVTPLETMLIEQGPTGAGHCHEVDHFLLCSAKTDFGLKSQFDSPMTPVNRIANASFEDGSVAPWTRFQQVEGAVTSDRAHGGSHSLAESAASGSLYQDVRGLKPGHIYAVTAWASGSPGATAAAQIAIYDPDAQATTLSQPAVAGERWRLMVQTASVSAAGTLRLYLVRQPGAGTIYWDDVRLYEDSTSGPENSLRNGGFEDGTVAPWTPFQAVHVGVTGSRAHSGTYSLAESDASGSVYQDIQGLEPGERCTITAWGSASRGATATAQIAVYDPVANHAAYSPPVVPGTEWQPFAYSVAVTSKGTLRIHLFRNSGAGTIYWDDVHISLAPSENGAGRQP